MKRFQTTDSTGVKFLYRQNACVNRMFYYETKLVFLFRLTLFTQKNVLVG